MHTPDIVTAATVVTYPSPPKIPPLCNPSLLHLSNLHPRQSLTCFYHFLKICVLGGIYWLWAFLEGCVHVGRRLQTPPSHCRSAHQQILTRYKRKRTLRSRSDSPVDILDLKYLEKKETCSYRNGRVSSWIHAHPLGVQKNGKGELAAARRQPWEVLLQLVVKEARPEPGNPEWCCGKEVILVTVRGVSLLSCSLLASQPHFAPGAAETSRAEEGCFPTSLPAWKQSY